MTGVVLAELLQGTRTQEERHLLSAKFQPLTFLETTQEIWATAGVLAAGLNRKGMTLPLTDIIIATVDDHFTRIPHVQLYKG